MGNVHALPSFSVPSNEPSAEVVAILERALEMAKSGKVQGVAVVTAEIDPMTNEFRYHGDQFTRHTLVSGVVGLMWSLGKSVGSD